MLRKQNLLTAGMMVLLSVSGQSYAVAGHPGGFGGGGNGGSHMNHSSSNNVGMAVRSNFNVQTPVNHNVGNLMSHQTATLNTAKSSPFLNNHTNSNLQQTVKLNQVQTPHNFQFPNNVKLGNSTNTIGNKISHLPVSSLSNHSNTAMKGLNFPGNFNPGSVGNVKPNFPIKPICPPLGGNFGKCGTGGCWGNYGGCRGNGFGWGCGNWGYGNCGFGNWGCGNYGCGSYGCGSWPGYFGCGNYGCSYGPGYFSSYNYPLMQSYSQPVYVPTYVSSAPVVTPAATSVVLNDTPLPPLPASVSSASNREIDLGIKEVRVVEAATADHGALYRVSIINKGPANLDTATRVAVLGFKDSQPSNDSPRIMESLKSLKVGETANLDLRLPIEANALPRMLVAVEVPDTYKDTNEANNVAAGEVSQLPPLAVAAR